jgi:hypothetical protein
MLVYLLELELEVLPITRKPFNNANNLHIILDVEMLIKAYI